jgi:hypothetical protein
MSTGIEQLVELWERTLPVSPVHRSVEILRMFPGAAHASGVESMTLSELDSELLRIRRMLFGDRFAALTVCQECGERSQMDFSAAAMEASEDPQPHTVSCMHDDIRLTIRAPTIGDLLAAVEAASPDAAGQMIVRRCIRSAERSGEPLDPEVFSAQLIDDAAARLERLESSARFTLEIRCPACGHAEEHAFDIGAYLWSEVQTEVMRALREVVQLARGYGWSEAEILAMTPLRRRLYLGMLPA